MMLPLRPVHQLWFALARLPYRIQYNILRSYRLGNRHDCVGQKSGLAQRSFGGVGDSRSQAR